MARALKIVGYGWLIIAGIVILGGYAMIAYEKGVWHALGLLSPHNLLNFIVTAAVLTPGLLCLWAAERLNERSGRRS